MVLWLSRTAGTKGNSIGIFVTDSGADQIAVIPAPASGNEPNFVADEALSATSGAAGKVFRYSIVLTVDTVVGDFTLVLLLQLVLVVLTKQLMFSLGILLIRNLNLVFLVLVLLVSSLMVRL